MRFLVWMLMGLVACSGGSDDDDLGATDALEEDEDEDEDEDEEEEGDADPVRVQDILSLTGNLDNGEMVYDDNCAACHGINGEGGVGPSMANALGEADTEIVSVILTGEEAMPAFDWLADQDVADVLTFMRDTF